MYERGNKIKCSPRSHRCANPKRRSPTATGGTKNKSSYRCPFHFDARTIRMFVIFLFTFSRVYFDVFWLLLLLLSTAYNQCQQKKLENVSKLLSGDYTAHLRNGHIRVCDEWAAKTLYNCVGTQFSAAAAAFRCFTISKLKKRKRTRYTCRATSATESSLAASRA